VLYVCITGYLACKTQMFASGGERQHDFADVPDFCLATRILWVRPFFKQLNKSCKH
jgi:hypothetical protein